MTFEETRAILKIVKAEYPQSFRGLSKDDAQAKLDLWAEMFAEDDAGIVGAAVKQIIASGEREFAPSVGQIKERMRTIRERMGCGYAWQARINEGTCKDGAETLGSVSRLARLQGLTWKQAKYLNGCKAQPQSDNG